MKELLVIDQFLSTTIGIVVFFLGAFLTRRVGVLREFNIPEPVTGGFAVALLIWAVYGLADVAIEFTLTSRDYFLVAFFATIGLNARVSDLRAGGRQLGVLLVVTVAYIVIQNAVALTGTTVFGLPAQVSVLLGSASLIGGHGTAIAWGPTVAEASGVGNAAEIGIATATLGLIAAASIGGPIAAYLIRRHKLEGPAQGDAVVGLEHEGRDSAPAQKIDHVSIMRTILVVHLAIMLGYVLNDAISVTGLSLPDFVTCLFAGIVLSNTVPYLLPRLTWPGRTPSLALFSDMTLSIFLAMSLMSMQLWTLAELGGTLVWILAAQVAVTVAFILIAVYPAMGRNYDAAVLSSGFAGFGLGATPTAIANMSAVTKQYGPAPLAFIVLPLVSAFFVDLANAIVIQVFVSL